MISHIQWIRKTSILPPITSVISTVICSPLSNHVLSTTHSRLPGTAMSHRQSPKQKKFLPPDYRVINMPRYLMQFISTLQCISIPAPSGSRGGAVVRALAFHRCGPGPGVVYMLSLFLVLSLAPRLFFRVLQFFYRHKNQHSKFKWNQWTNSHSVDVPLQIPIYFTFTRHDQISLHKHSKPAGLCQRWMHPNSGWGKMVAK